MKVYLQPEMYNPIQGGMGFTLVDYQVNQFGITLLSDDLKFSTPWPNKTLSVLQVKSSRKALSGFVLDFKNVTDDLIKLGQFTTSMRCLFGKQTNGTGRVSGKIITVNITYKLPPDIDRKTVLVDREFIAVRSLAGFAGFERHCEEEVLDGKQVVFEEDGGFVNTINIECDLIAKPSLQEAFRLVYDNRHPKEDHCFTIPYFNPIRLDINLEIDNPNISEFMYRTGADLTRYDDGTSDFYIDDGYFSKTISPRMPLKELELWSETANSTQ